MIIKTDLLKEKCSLILNAVDSNELSVVTETLQIKTIGKRLSLAVTNREYFVEIFIDLDFEENFHATVNANLFLKLISQITTPTIELNIAERSLIVKGNGKYNLPLIFDNDTLLELPEIKINNVTVSQNISSEILNNILTYNTKELTRGTIARPVQRLYYVDEQGAITFTTGACVNSFTLEKPIRVLLNQKVVKLFKLFNDVDVRVDLGFDSISDQIIQTKIKFETKDTILTAILSCDDTLLNSVPVEAIRGRSDKIYDYSIVLNRDGFLQSINRLLLFNLGYGTREINKPFSLLQFDTTSVKVWDAKKENYESIDYANNSTIAERYEATIDLTDLKSVLENKIDEYITLNFGDGRAFVLVKNNIKFVIPEVKTV